MKALFTKDIDHEMVSEIFGNSISFDVCEMLRIRHRTVKAFDLKNFSLIFSSANGVKSFFANGFRPNENFMELNYNKIYAVGAKTKTEIRRHGFGTFKMTRNAQELCDFVTEHGVHERFLHFCGNLSLDILNEQLPLQNIRYRKVVIYDTELLYPKTEAGYDAIAFFSPSGVRSFMKNNIPAQAKLFCIGQTTEKELRRYTHQKIWSSRKNTPQDLLKIMAQEMKRPEKA